MKPVVYVESSVISYLTARPNRDVVAAGRQTVTSEWWDKESARFELRVSALVEDEISRGDHVAAQSRLAAIEKTRWLPSRKKRGNFLVG